jgi:hypothetical protein
VAKAWALDWGLRRVVGRVTEMGWGDGGSPRRLTEGWGELIVVVSWKGIVAAKIKRYSNNSLFSLKD